MDQRVGILNAAPPCDAAATEPIAPRLGATQKNLPITVGHHDADLKYPFPQPGRWQGKKKLPANTEKLLPWSDIRAYDGIKIAPRFVKAPLSLSEFRSHVSTLADDAGVISINHPAIAHEFDEVRYLYPHARSLVILVTKENTVAMQSRYTPSANRELYDSEECLLESGRKVIRYINSLGGEGLTTAMGWPMEVPSRWPDKIWPLSHRLVALAAGLGVTGMSRMFLHRKFGSFCLLDTVVTNLEFEESAYNESPPPSWTPCLDCNLCVAACPSGAVRSDGEFDFFKCYNHTYRDSIPGFIDFARDLAEGNQKKFEHRWSDAELAALWQSLTFRTQYRCFNCIAVCSAHISDEFQADKKRRALQLKEIVKPLTHTRGTVEEQFIVDTPSVRDAHDIPPGKYRSKENVTTPGRHGVVRLVQLNRLRVSNIDTMMRMMPYYFRANEAKGLDFTGQINLTGDGGGQWVLRVAEERCNVRRGSTPNADITLTCDGRVFLAIHRGDLGPVTEVLRGRVKLKGQRTLILAILRIFVLRLFPAFPEGSMFHQIAWYARRTWRRWKELRTNAAKKK